MMDILKEELQRQQKALLEQTGGKRIFKRSELEQKRIQQLRLEEQREAEQKAIRENPQIPDSNPNSSCSNPNSLSDPAKTRPDSSSTCKQKIVIRNLPKQEVIRWLRFLKQAITLFGEDDEARLNRMEYVLEAGLFEVDDDMTEGQTNDFLRDIVELKKRQKMGDRKGKRKMSREEDNDDDELSGGDLKRMRSDFEELCDEDKILVFFKRLLIQWKHELQDMDKRTAKGKSTVAAFQQCVRYLNPLFMFCRKKILQDDIRQALMLMVNCCKKREYLAAMYHYIRMAIGNAPWPIGVTMVGIHERSAREKIHTNSVAHIMNDETTRKYLQSVKRLMTFCQRRYPTMPSKAVEFNSLANGSDLQSLLAEERGHVASQPDEERLQLMA